MADYIQYNADGSIVNEGNFGTNPLQLKTTSNTSVGVYAIYQFLRPGPVYVALWGQGTNSARGAYVRVNELTIDTSKYYLLFLGLGRGSAGTSYGWVTAENGGGFTGIFEISQPLLSSTPRTPLIIAGGAGGTGYGHGSSPGGNGGAYNGGAGTTSSDSEIGSTGGGGGTTTNGGGGGGAGGQQGNFLNGGKGGNGVTGGYPNAGGGGGGGGGYYGGGGGGGGNDFGNGTRNASGGGGGSSYINTSRCSGTFISNSGTGEYITNPSWTSNAGLGYTALAAILGEGGPRVKFRQSNTWRDIKEVHVKTSYVDDNGTIINYDPPQWKKIKEAYEKRSGVWTRII